MQSWAWLLKLRKPTSLTQDEDEYDTPDRGAFDERKLLQQAQQDHLQFPDEVGCPLCASSLATRVVAASRTNPAWLPFSATLPLSCPGYVV